MKVARFSVFIFGLLSLACPATAGFDDSNKLLQVCTGEAPFEKGFCYGLITGYFEGMQTDYTCSKVDPNIHSQTDRGCRRKILEGQSSGSPSTGSDVVLARLLHGV